MSKLIGIDPGYAKKTAIAWTDETRKYAGSELIDVASSVVEKDTRDLKKHAKAIYDFIIKTIEVDDNAIIGIEGQFIGKNIRMTLELVEFRSLITGMLYLKKPKIKVYTILPHTWQSFILEPPKGTKSPEMKELSKIAAEKLIGSSYGDDISDAICILKYLMEKF